MSINELSPLNWRDLPCSLTAYPGYTHMEQVRLATHLQIMLVDRVGLQVDPDECRFIRN